MSINKLDNEDIILIKEKQILESSEIFYGIDKRKEKLSDTLTYI